ncbi:hypothetical protein BVRB_9g216720 [Beta vulgaris subsp. vulgaris]|nr:hypothetical protein BVRB_9g216720 [Beta vulgaris subsp. vulgaris]
MLVSLFRYPLLKLFKFDKYGIAEILENFWNNAVYSMYYSQ